MTFDHFDRNTAPAESKPILEGVEKKMGFVPELYAYISASPAALKGYRKLDELLDESGLSPQEKQLALLTTSVTNRCEFCVAAHTAGGTKAGLDENTLAAVRRAEDPADPKQAALVRFVRTLVNKQGWAPESEVKRFLDAGFDKANVFDVILAVSLKTLSNYTNHLAQPGLNPELEQFAWDSDKAA